MRYSIYNTIIPITENSEILYNAISDKFVLFKSAFEDDIRNFPPDYLKEAHPGLYKDLLDGGAIVDSDLNEYDFLVNLSQQVDAAQDEYQLMINPTMDCNFKCWYCYETHIRGSKMRSEIVNRVNKHISDIIASNKNIKAFRLKFFGGEPLLYYKSVVMPIINHAVFVVTEANVLLNIHFTTNGFLVNQALINHLIAYNQNVTFQITLDGHREQHNQTRMLSNGTGSYDKIFENIKELASNDFEVILRINYTQENLDSVKDILSDFADLTPQVKDNIGVSFHSVWQDGDVQKKRLEDIDSTVELFREKFKASNPHYDMDEVRNSCYADKVNEAVINYNGEVFKCTARNFSSENRCGILNKFGHIEWANDILARKVSSKLNMPICRDCRILPLCGGSCSQKAIELAGKNFCVADMNEQEKDSVVLHRFYTHCVNE